MSENSDIFESQSYNSVVLNDTAWLFGTNISGMFDPSSIKSMVQDPMSNNAKLRELSRVVYNANGIVTNTVDKMVALPTLDKVIVPYGDSKTKKKSNHRMRRATTTPPRDTGGRSA